MNTLTEAQKAHYGTLWTAADSDRDGSIGATDAASFFHLSGLSQDVLGSIWNQVCPSGSSLSPDQFVYYCELISMAQNGVTPNLQELLRIKGLGTPIPFPTFSGIGAPTQAAAVSTPQATPVADQV